jgi:hypothetical protein
MLAQESIVLSTCFTHRPCCSYDAALCLPKTSKCLSRRGLSCITSHILANEGIRFAVLTTEVPPESRDGWYERQLCAGVQAVICHPKLVQTDSVEPSLPDFL